MITFFLEKKNIVRVKRGLDIFVLITKQKLLKQKFNSSLKYIIYMPITLYNVNKEYVRQYANSTHYVSMGRL